jgi:tRNA threonylcarbamoyladenosine biosynthesis protein TsaE
LKALGVQGKIKSPTYAVLETYSVPGCEISHFDFFRFSDPHEFEDAGFREVFSRAGLKMVEWPQKAAGQLPTPDLRLHIEPMTEDRREVQVEALTPQGLALMATMDEAHVA